MDSRAAGLSRREAIGLLGVGAGLGLLTTLREEAGLLAAPYQAAAARAQAATFPKGAVIRTILKDVSPEALGSGWSLFHDHVILTNPYPFVNSPW